VHHHLSARQRARLTFVSAVLTLALLVPSALTAQNKFSFTPWIGSYYPLAKFYDNTFDLTTIGAVKAEEDRHQS